MGQPYRKHRFPSGLLVEIAQGDITTEEVDAIVNAANAHLAHGAGVAGAIVRKGGQQIQVESNQWVREHGPVTQGKPAYTRAGNLPCRYVIHVVGPIWGEGDEDRKLEMAITEALRLADTLWVTSVALPALSSGIFGFPKERAARLILHAIQDYAGKGTGLKTLRLVLFDQETLQAFMKVWDQDDHLGA